MNEATESIITPDLCTATYSAEDNKLRLYPFSRLESEVFAAVKAEGFKWAPKQELFVAPKWTPSREDFCLKIAGEIGAEETTLVERAQAKAERLDALGHKRAHEADSYAEAVNRISKRFEAGQPILVGHHSEKKARKDQEKMHRAMEQSNKAAKAVDYWSYRAEGVEAHANYKLQPRVIQRRIKTLLADLRGWQRQINFSYKCLELWQEIGNIENVEELQKNVDFYSQAFTNEGDYSPRKLSDSLRNGDIDHKTVVEESIKLHELRINSEYYTRWICHILNRLGFERSQLGEVKRFEGDLTATILQAFTREQGADKPKAVQKNGCWVVSSEVPLPLHLSDEKCLSLGDSQWRDLMVSVGYEVVIKARRKSTSTANQLPIINPSKDEAIKLQALWNDVAKKNNTKRICAVNNVAISEMTQATYSENSKGDYARCNMISLDATGRKVEMKWEGMQRVESGEPVCRVRIYTGGEGLYSADSLISVSDKPNKVLPISWETKQEAVA